MFSFLDTLEQAGRNFNQLTLDEKLLVSLADSLSPLASMTSNERNGFQTYLDEQVSRLTFQQRLFAGVLQQLQGRAPLPFSCLTAGEYSLPHTLNTSNWRATAYDLAGYPDATVIVAKVPLGGNVFDPNQARIIVTDPAGFAGFIQFSL